MPTGLRSPRRTPLRACRRSARAWALSSATVPAVTPCQIERDRWSRRVSVRAASLAAAIWSQKGMRSPSGGEARHRGGTQVGKAPPSPEMTLSSLTRGQVFGEDQDADLDFSPALPDGAARPSGGLFRF